MESKNPLTDVNLSLVRSIYGHAADPNKVPPEILELLKVVTADGTTSLSDIPSNHKDIFEKFAGTITVFSHKGKISSGADDWLEYLRWRVALLEEGLDATDVPHDNKSNWQRNHVLRGAQQ